MHKVTPLLVTRGFGTSFFRVGGRLFCPLSPESVFTGAKFGQDWSAWDVGLFFDGFCEGVFFGEFVSWEGHFGY